MLLDMEVFRLTLLADLYKAENEIIKKIKRYTDAKYDNYGIKKFNYDFTDNPQDYELPELLPQYKGNPEKLERFLTTKEIEITEEHFKHLSDLFIALNHKLSGCVSYLESLSTGIKQQEDDLDQESKDLLNKELDRLDLELSRRSLKWHKVMKGCVDFYESIKDRVIRTPSASDSLKELVRRVIMDIKHDLGDYEDKREIEENHMNTIFKLLSHLQPRTRETNEKPI